MAGEGNLGSVDMDISVGNQLLSGEDGRGARKRLVSEDGTITVRGQPVPNLVGKVNNTVLMIESGGETVEIVVPGPSNSTPGKHPIVKRRKQGVGEEEGEDQMTNVAASGSEDRRAQ